MKLNKNIAGTQITDELFQRSSVTASRLVHDTIRANTFAIRTDSGGGGDLLVLNTDYTLGGIDSRLTTDGGVDVFTTVAIINATFHDTDLYATYLTVGDYAEAGDSFPNNIKLLKEIRLPVGAIIQSMGALTPSVWDSDDPMSYEPIYDIQAGGTINTANYPDFVPYLRSQLVRVGATTAFTGSAAASVITLDNNADNLALLEALLEDQLNYSAYNRPITWGGTDYVITAINGVTRAITVTGTPTAGAGSATFHPYRIVGSTTTARILAHDGLVLATGGASGRVTGLVTRDRMQQITGVTTLSNSIGIRDGAIQAGAFGSGDATTARVGADASGGSTLTFDSADSPGARTGTTTRDRSLSVRFYAHVGRYE